MISFESTITFIKQLINDLPPLRSLDDFLLGSDRFQMPNKNDVENYKDRLTKNFLYYQTNYYLMATIIIGVFGLYQLFKTLSSLITIIVLIFVLIKYLPVAFGGRTPPPRATTETESSEATQMNSILIVLGTLIVIYVFLRIINAMLLVILISLLPLTLSWIHASLRIRKFDTPTTNVIEERLRASPMCLLMGSMRMTMDHHFN